MAPNSNTHHPHYFLLSLYHCFSFIIFPPFCLEVTSHRGCGTTPRPWWCTTPGGSLTITMTMAAYIYHPLSGTPAYVHAHHTYASIGVAVTRRVMIIIMVMFYYSWRQELCPGTFRPFLTDTIMYAHEMVFQHWYGCVSYKHSTTMLHLASTLQLRSYKLYIFYSPLLGGC